MPMDQKLLRPTRRRNRSDIQSFYFTPVPTAGSFTITINGNTSAGIAYDASTSDIKAAL